MPVLHSFATALLLSSERSEGPYPDLYSSVPDNAA